MSKRIIKKNSKEDTGCDFVSYEDRSIWGFDSKGQYQCFSKKYYQVKEIDDRGIVEKKFVFTEFFD